jgi:phosphotriesterase-related protein
LKTALGGTVCLSQSPAPRQIMTVTGAIPAKSLGKTLIHEHILVDFVGADRIRPDRWDRQTVRRAVMPYLDEVKKRGVQSILDCTPAFLGRDVRLLQEISQESGLSILTNTGYYGAVDNKYLPTWAFTETDAQLAARWIREFEEGIEGTPVRPGFIKIGVGSGALSELHQKLVRAAAMTHLATGLTICSHTGPALPAFQEMEILHGLGVHPSAFVWVHAQNESDKSRYTTAAKKGAWVSLDGMGWGNFDGYATWLHELKVTGQLNKVLISHDAGWYRPDEANPMEKFVGYTNLFDNLFPLLKEKGFSEKDFDQLLRKNPAEAFGIALRKR